MDTDEEDDGQIDSEIDPIEPLDLVEEESGLDRNNKKSKNTSDFEVHIQLDGKLIIIKDI